MRRILFAVALLFSSHAFAGTFTAATCGQSDVNAVINGPTHTAVNGDIIQIPTGTCTWTSPVIVTVNITITGLGSTPNTGAATFGSATNAVTIKSNYSGAELFQLKPTYNASINLVTLQNINIDPVTSGTTLYSPIGLAGTCTASGCPNVRLDNVGLGIGTQWTETGNGTQAAALIRADNVFGVIDHCTQPAGSQVWFINISNSAYLGVGGFGDNSWAQADTFGTASALYGENNVIYTTTSVSDAEFAPSGGGIGGGREAWRFNHVNATDAGFFVAFTFHGLDTDGRPQGGRAIEAYDNIINCENGSCGAGVAGFRSGTGKVFGNTLNANFAVTGGFYNNISDITVYRTVFTAGGGWGGCGNASSGSAAGPYDTNDGTTYFSGIATTGSSGLTLDDALATFPTTGGGLIPTGSPYSVFDITQGFVAEVASNTATSITIQGNIPEQTNSFSVGDSYQVRRSTVCADQGGRGAGNYVSGSTPSPSAALSQALDPIYEWDNTASNLNHGNIDTDTGRTIANRDWYTDNSNGSPTAQTSATSPFNGSGGSGIGVGFGTLARRPTTCTTGVGYFATDQGSWNSAGSSGLFYTCTSTNTWTQTYTPYTYPHPLTAGGGGTTPPVQMAGKITMLGKPRIQ